MVLTFYQQVFVTDPQIDFWTFTPAIMGVSRVSVGHQTGNTCSLEDKMIWSQSGRLRNK